MDEKLYLICPNCGRTETNPYDIGDTCYCNGIFRLILIQIHHQFKDGKTIMCLQGEANDLQRLLKETKISHPLPEGAIWMVCDELSENFIKQIPNQCIQPTC